MTQDEIIEMARQAGFVVTHIGDPIGTNYAMIEAFANLVAEKECNACFDFAIKAAEALIDTATALEREACAKVVEECDWPKWAEPTDARDVFAEAIRARGEA